MVLRELTCKRCKEVVGYTISTTEIEIRCPSCYKKHGISLK